MGFPGGSVVRNLLANAGDAGDVVSTPGLGRSPGGGHGDLLQYFCWENVFGRGAWWAPVLGYAKNLTRLSTQEVIWQLLLSHHT